MWIFPKNVWFASRRMTRFVQIFSEAKAAARRPGGRYRWSHKEARADKRTVWCYFLESWDRRGFRLI
jgi:hypothetical protein